MEKLLGMLGSTFDGERAVAAKKISEVACSNKITIAELMKECFGSTARRFEEPKPRQQYKGSEDDPKLIKMKGLIKIKGMYALSSWEKTFATDILERGGFLSEKQAAVVERIISKLEKYDPDF